MSGSQKAYVSSAHLSQFWSEDCDSSQWIILLFWSALSTSAGDTRIPPRDDGGTQPPLPPLDVLQLSGIFLDQLS